MSLDSAIIWGQDVATAIAAIGVDDSAEVTPAQLALVWAAIKQVTIDNMAKGAVAPGTFANGGGPVTGIGGPIT